MSAPPAERLATPRIQNLSPHPIVVRGDDGVEHRFEPSGQVARLGEKVRSSTMVEGVTVADVELDRRAGLPEPQVGVRYLVSLAVALAHLQDNRDDLLTPDTSAESAIRDDAGRIVAVRRLRHVVSPA